MNKVFFMAIAAVAISFSATAQTEKGKLMLGGNVSYDYQKVENADNASHAFQLAPSVGYFFGDNFAAGLGLGYGYYENVSGASAFGIADQIHAFQLAPFARAYQGDGDFKFFGQLSVPMAWGTAHVNDEKIGSLESYGVAVSPGFAWFPTSKIGLELSVKGLYFENNTINPEIGSKVTQNSFGLNADSFAPKIGVQFYF